MSILLALKVEQIVPCHHYYALVQHWEFMSLYDGLVAVPLAIFGTEELCACTFIGEVHCLTCSFHRKQMFKLTSRNILDIHFNDDNVIFRAILQSRAPDSFGLGLGHDIKFIFRFLSLEEELDLVIAYSISFSGLLRHHLLLLNLLFFLGLFGVSI